MENDDNKNDKLPAELERKVDEVLPVNGSRQHYLRCLV